MAHRTVLIFDRLQHDDTRHGEDILALAASFILLAHKLRVEPQEVFTIVKNLMTDRMQPDGYEKRFSAIAQHLEDDYEV